MQAFSQKVARHENAHSSTFRDHLIAAIPKLRAFALSLASHSDYADDLVQETLMKAWNHQDSFQAGTNIKAWLFTILRNEYFSQLRKRRREVEDADGDYAGNVMTPGGQESQLDMADLRIALAHLPDDQREAVVLVGASGFSYQEVAEICQVPVGTIKSRVNRARNKLAILLNEERAGANDDNAVFQPQRSRMIRKSHSSMLRATLEHK